jgi:hypothetical protein
MLASSASWPRPLSLIVGDAALEIQAMMEQSYPFFPSLKQSPPLFHRLVALWREKSLVLLTNERKNEAGAILRSNQSVYMPLTAATGQEGRSQTKSGRKTPRSSFLIT